MATLHTEVFDPETDDAPTVLALHGVTGHGRRWAPLAAGALSDVRIVAPDLLGHGHSPWQPPWSIDHHVDAISQVIDDHIPTDARPIVVVGHSFGGALAVHLAHRRPDVVKGLVLLDPAQGLDPDTALTMATDTMDHWDYADADAARSAKMAEAWGDVPTELLQQDIDDHLVERPDGRVGWRVSAPAVATAWSEMARPALLPPPEIPTRIVVADRVQPPFVGAEFLDGCAADRPDSVRVAHADCGHMVPFVEPDLTARLVRELL
ncbi:alpha/beta hydrolase [Gordonia sinesedis]